mgnify:CR=1 FL=1
MYTNTMMLNKLTHSDFIRSYLTWSDMCGLGAA